MSNSDVETLSQFKQTTLSKNRLADEAGPSNAPQNTTTPSTPGRGTTDFNNTPSTDDLYTDTFNFALSKIFSRTLLASLTSKDAILKEVRDCMNTNNKERCRQISPYIHSYWKDMHVKNGRVCVDDRIAIPNSIKDTYIEAIHATHPVSWEVTDMAVHSWLPYVDRVLVSKTEKCNPNVMIGKDLKSIIPSSKWATLKLCKIPNEEIQ